MKNKKGIIYAVVGVAVLVIAIVGSTIAFFATTAGTNTTAITGNTGKGAALQLTVTRVHPASNPGPLVPLDVDPASGDTSQLGDALSHNCIDSATNTVCHIYSIKVKNTSSGVVNVAGTLTLTSAAPNLKWKFLSNATTDNNDGTFRSPSSTAVNITSSETLQATNGEQTYYVMVWLEETGTDQGTGASNDTEKNFSGTVTFNAVDTSGNVMDGLTAVFGSGANNQTEEIPEGVYLVTGTEIEKGKDLNEYDDSFSQLTKYNHDTVINGKNAIELAMGQWADLSGIDGYTAPVFLRFTLGTNTITGESDVPVAGYIGFKIDDELKDDLKEECAVYYSDDPDCETKIDNLNNGTYYLRGWVDESNEYTTSGANTIYTGTVYKANAKTLYDAFGSNCDTNPYTTPINNSFGCYVMQMPGFYADVNSSGYVNVGGYAYADCYINDNGSTYCAFG